MKSLKQTGVFGIDAFTGLPERIAALCAGIYTILMSGFFVLAYHNNYIDIQDFKAVVFTVLGAVFIIVETICFFLAVGGRHQKNTEVHAEKKCMKLFAKGYVFQCLGGRVCAAACALMVGAILIGWAGCEWKDAAAWGNMGRRLGAVPLIMCILIYVYISFFLRPSRWIFVSICVVTMAEIILGILNFFGIDPLGMYSNLIPEQHDFFIGTMGNRNVTVGYMCLVLPVFMAVFVLARSWRCRSLSAVGLLAGFYYGLGLLSDSFLIGMGCAFLILLWYCLSRPGRFRLLGQVCALFWSASFLMMLTQKLYPDGSPFLRALSSAGIIGIWLQERSIAVSGVLTLIVVVISFFIETRQFSLREDRLRRIRNGLFLSFSVAAALLLAGVVRVNTFSPERQSELTGMAARLLLTDDFGSNRGYIWKRSVEMFGAFPLFKKMFGIGADCFYLQAIPLYGNEMMVLFGAPFADAHNEFLQFLITLGMIGAGSYFALLLSGFFRKKETGGSLLRRIVLAAYIGQGLVNNPQIFTTPLLFVLLGICNALDRTDNAF